MYSDSRLLVDDLPLAELIEHQDKSQNSSSNPNADSHSDDGSKNNIFNVKKDDVNDVI